MIWESVLTSGRDFFDELPELGLSATDQHRPPYDAAREAWALYGPRILAERRLKDGTPWALREFGQP